MEMKMRDVNRITIRENEEKRYIVNMLRPKMSSFWYECISIYMSLYIYTIALVAWFAYSTL